jgi:YD repeat-containing protein
VTAVTTGAGTTTFAYNERGELATAADPTGSITSYTRDHLGRPVLTTLPNGHTIARNYDSMGRTTRITYSAPGGQVLYDLAYTRDGTGRIARQEESHAPSSTVTTPDRVVEEKITEPGGGYRR